MISPRLTAETLLYQTIGHYWTSRQVDKSSTETIVPIYPVREMEEEAINVRSCAPGWTDIGGFCWPDLLTEPSGGSSGGKPGEPGGGGSGGGGGGGLGDYWVCKDGCETVYSKCLDTCEGTVDNPKPSRNCLMCDDSYRRCLRVCSRNIA